MNSNLCKEKSRILPGLGLKGIMSKSKQMSIKSKWTDKINKKVDKKYINTIAGLTVTVLILFSNLIYCLIYCHSAYAAGTAINENDLYAKSALLMDADSKRVLYHKNGYEQLPMASTTKIMTCLVALENSNPEDIVEFSSYAASMPKVKLGASSGSKFYMKDMLYSLMLESHNDTAVAIAEAVAGSVEEFAKLMNERAKLIGAENTNFVTPNGLDAPQHYTTAYDLALIASEAIKNQEFLEIINTRSHSFSKTEGNGSYVVNNKDAFLGMMEGAMGIKTGFTGNAGYCFVGAVRRNNKTLISVVLGSGWPPAKTYKWKDTMKLMNFGLDHYEYRVLFDGIDDYKNIEVINGVESEVGTCIKGELSSLMSDFDNVEYKYEMEDRLNAPVKEKQKVGEMKVIINDREFANFEICTKNAVKRIDFEYSLLKILKKFFL